VSACRPSRREFLGGLAGAAAFSRVLGPSLVGAASAKGGPWKIGCAAILWGGKDRDAIDDTAALGYQGIQLRSNVYAEWGEKPAELKALLASKKLELLCFSSGSLDALPDKREEYLATHLKHARFVQALGGHYMQVVSNRPKDHAPSAEEFKALAELLNDIGKKAAEIGPRLVYHNHMHAFGEAPDEVARLMDLTDPKAVSLLLDIAHYTQGGGDPAAGARRHKDRIAVVHLKDVKGPLPDYTGEARYSYKFVELGRGRVDIPGAVAALREVGYKGSMIAELDAPPEPDQTPKDCARTNIAYIKEKLRIAL
jgi:inosose dehydratase